jgi:hypothetical protein
MNGRRSRIRVVRLILVAVVALGVAFFATPLSSNVEVEWNDGPVQTVTVGDDLTITTVAPATVVGSVSVESTADEVEWN